MVLKMCHTDHLSHGQVYHNIKKLKLPCMPSKEEQESGMVKFVNVGSASITKKT